MTMLEKLIDDFNTLDEQGQAEVIDFVGYIKQKQENKLGNLADKLFDKYDKAFEELAK